MAWTGLTLTVDGRNALNQAQINNRLCFKAIVIGDGNPPGNFGTQKSLVHPLYELTDLKVDMTDEGCALTADFPAVDDDYYFREIGVIVATEDGDKLYVYDNCGDDAQYIVSTTGAERTQKRIRLYLTISDVADVMVSAPAILYVDYDEYEKDIEELNQKIDVLGTNDISGIGDGSVTGALTALKESTSNNEDALIALEQVMGTKAGQAETESALARKLDKTGDAKDTTVTFASADVADGGAGAWTSVGKLSTGEKLGSAFNKVSMMFKNIRYLYKMLGTTNISAIGGGTVTGAISKLNTDLDNIGNMYNTSSHQVSLPNNVLTEVCSTTVPYTGIYFIFAQTAITGNNNGTRLIELSNSTGYGYGQTIVSAATIGGGGSYIQVNSIGAINITAGTKIIVRIQQNSGDTLVAKNTYLAPVYISSV